MKVHLVIGLLLWTNLVWGQSEAISVKRIQHHIERSEKLERSSVNSALEEAILANRNISEHTPTVWRARTFNRLGDVYKLKGDAVNALKYYLKSKTIIDSGLLNDPGNVSLELLNSDTHLRIGTLYLQLKNYKMSLSYYGKALEVLEQATPKMSKNKIAAGKLKVYNNMAAVFIRQRDFDMALIYFRNALELNEIVKEDSYQGSILNNMGICYLEKKELDLASHYFQQSLKIRKETGDEPGQAQVLNNIGKNEVFKRNFGLANEYFKQALSLSRKTGNNESELISLECLSSVNDTLGNYHEALSYYKAYKVLNDKMFNLESKTAIASLEEKYRREDDKKRYELKLKESESDRLKSLVLVVVLLFLLLALGFIVFVMRNRMQKSGLQQEKLALERENLDLVRRTLEENLEFKEKELTAKALFLLKNNELIARITESLQKAKPAFTRDNQQLIQEIIADLKSNQRNNGWDEFELHFTRVHSQFYRSLQEKFPTLTSNEKKLCAFLRLNMSTKDISAITNQTVNSITVARTRLRKKLGIDGEDVHLINFLMTL